MRFSPGLTRADKAKLPRRSFDTDHGCGRSPSRNSSAGARAWEPFHAVRGPGALRLVETIEPRPD
jgi:hypothetical protein